MAPCFPKAGVFIMTLSKKKTRKNQRKTPRSRVKSSLRRLFLQSRERNYALKNAVDTCRMAGLKKDIKKMKLEVHHKKPIDWERIFTAIYEELLCPPEELEVMTKEEHRKLTNDYMANIRKKNEII